MHIGEGSFGMSFDIRQKTVTLARKMRNNLTRTEDGGRARQQIVASITGVYITPISLGTAGT